MQESLTPFPKLLNEPDSFGFWPWKEMFTFMIPIFMVGMMYSLWLGIMLGIGAVMLLRRLQQSDYGDLTRVGPYWCLPFSRSKYKVIFPSHIREVLG